MGAHQFPTSQRIRAYWEDDTIGVYEFPNGYVVAQSGRKVFHKAQANTPEEREEIAKAMIEIIR